MPILSKLPEPTDAVGTHLKLGKYGFVCAGRCLYVVGPLSDLDFRGFRGQSPESFFVPFVDTKGTRRRLPSSHLGRSTSNRGNKKLRQQRKPKDTPTGMPKHQRKNTKPRKHNENLNSHNHLHRKTTLNRVSEYLLTRQGRKKHILRVQTTKSPCSSSLLRLFFAPA